MSAFKTLCNAIETLNATKSLSKKILDGRPPSKRYCKSCGSEMNVSSYTHEFDSWTGSPNEYYRFTCPKRSSYWFIRIFSQWHERFSTDGTGVCDPLDE